MRESERQQDSLLDRIGDLEGWHRHRLPPAGRRARDRVDARFDDVLAQLHEAGYDSGSGLHCLPPRPARPGPERTYGSGFALQRAVEDVQALMDGTQARRVFALSAGAIPVLQWALCAPADYKIALYEPPLPVRGCQPAAWLTRYDSEMSQGRPGAAMVTVARGTKDSRLLQVLPRAVAVPLMDFAMRAQAKQAAADEVALIDLILTMHHDAQLVLGATGLIQASTAMHADVLLLGGSRSPRYLRDALDALHAAVPLSRTVILPGVGHLAADNGGHPNRAARVLCDYFSVTPESVDG